MVASIEGWGFITTPISFLGIHPATQRFFSYFITFQVLCVGALYRRKRVKPFLAFIGLGSLFLVDIYNMETHNAIHNFFALVFFVTQPIIFFWEYKSKKDSLFPTKGVVLSILIVLLLAGWLPLPIFEFLSYTLLILFL
tara:strand:+ start:892 stop:1308 length:417 start_codon:yes stop_codon:yes gene_type:complete